MTLGIVLVVFGLVARSSFRPERFGDFDFHRDAKAWSEAVRGAAPWTTVHIGRAPGPVFYYLIPYLAVTPGSSDDAYWLAGFLWTLIWVCAAMILLRRVGEELDGPQTGWWALAFTLAPPFVVYYAFGIGPDVPAFIGVVFFCWGWAAWRRSVSASPFTGPWWATWLGLSAAILCRPNVIFVFPIAGICAAAMWMSKDDRRRARAPAVSLGILLAAALSLISVVLIQRLGGSYQAGNLAHVVLQGRFQYRTEPWDWRYWGKDYRSGSRDYESWAALLGEFRQQASRSGESLSALEWNWIRNDVLGHPGLSLRMVGVRLLAINVVFANGPGGGTDVRSGRRIASFGFHLLANVAYLSSIVLALVYLARHRHAALDLWPLWCCWVALLAFHALTYAEPRYLLPGRAGMVLLAALMVREMKGNGTSLDARGTA